MAKVIVYLRDTELGALTVLAQREFRVPRAQAALIIRKELERLGLVSMSHPNMQTRTDQENKGV